MRTNIEIDEKLLQRAMRLTGAKTKKAAIEAAMQLTVQIGNQAEAIQKLWGIGWEGDLDEMRENEHLDWDSSWQAVAGAPRRSVA